MAAGGHGVEGFGKAVHIHRALHHGVQPGLAQGVRHAQAVDDRAEHAHLVRRDGVHAGGGTLAAAPDIARADHDTDLGAHIVHTADDFSRPVDLVKIEKIAAGFERLAAQLQKYPMIYSHVNLLRYALRKV